MDLCGQFQLTYVTFHCSFVVRLKVAGSKGRRVACSLINWISDTVHQFVELGKLPGSERCCNKYNMQSARLCQGAMLRKAYRIQWVPARRSAPRLAARDYCSKFALKPISIHAFVDGSAVTVPCDLLCLITDLRIAPTNRHSSAILAVQQTLLTQERMHPEDACTQARHASMGCTEATVE